MDYPQQLKAINHCYVSHIRSDLKITDATLFECMKRFTEIAPETTGHGLPLRKCEAYNRVYDQPYESR